MTEPKEYSGDDPELLVLWKMGVPLQYQSLDFLKWEDRADPSSSPSKYYKYRIKPKDES